MAIFKYSVANTEGKKLSGTVEAPDESTARTELNNLGFSILLLQETFEQPKLDASLSKFVFEAIDKNSKLISGTIPAKDEKEALKKLEEEYSLNVNAIWNENSTQEQIQTAKTLGQQRLQENLSKVKTNTLPTVPTHIEETPALKSADDEKREIIVRQHIENVLKEVNTLLQNFAQDFSGLQKTEINKKIDKLLRIKNSNNLEYILATAKELLEYLIEQEKTFSKNLHQERRVDFYLQTKKMLHELNINPGAKTLSEDIQDKITNWQKVHVVADKPASGSTKLINKFLQKVKDFFTTPEDIATLKDQIKIYNRQLFETAKLYFKEPTPEYKAKVKNTFKTIWGARKKAKENLKALKQAHKQDNKEIKDIRQEEHLLLSFTEELNSLTGWILAFYVGYYFVGLYLNTKDFGLDMPLSQGFAIYETRFLKYLLVTIFLLHCSTAIKLNFFKTDTISNFVIPPIFLFTTIIALLNF